MRMRHLRICSHLWAGPSPTKEHKSSWKCMSGIGHSQVLANSKESDRELWKYIKQFEITGQRGYPGKGWGEKPVAFRLKCLSFLDCPRFPFTYLGWSKVTPVSSVIFTMALPGSISTCPGSPRENWTHRTKMYYHCSPINPMHHFLVYSYLKDEVCNLTETSIFIKPSNFKAFNSFVLRLLLYYALGNKCL